MSEFEKIKAELLAATTALEEINCIMWESFMVKIGHLIEKQAIK